MKKIIKFISALLFSCLFFLAGCEVEDASVKVKFYDSINTETVLIPGSHDLSDIINDGLSSYTATKEGYDFVGWTLDVEGKNSFDPAALVNSEEPLIKVYAQWDELRKIACYSGTNLIETYYYDDLVAKKEKLADATKDGYRFISWTTDSENKNVFDLTTFTYPSDVKTVKIYADFDIITKVTFNNGSIVVDEKDLYDLKKGTATLPTVTKEGYTFDGWYLDENFENKFDSKNYEAVNAQLNVYAKFTAKPKVIYYNGSDVFTSYYLEDAATAVVGTPSKEGYNFIGWVDANGDAFTVNTSAKESQIAYAKFDQKVSVKFYSGTELVSTKYLEALDSDTLPVATKETYTFKGWYTDAECTNAFVVDGFVASGKTVNVYAKFEKITTITFKNGSEEVAKVLLSSLKDGTATIPNVNKYGYTFNGWSTDEAGQNAFVYRGLVTDEANILVYANWTAKPRVNFYVDETLFDSKLLEEATASYLPANNPIKEGYDFIGWTNSNGDAFTLDIESEISVNAYAKFEQKVSVKFYADAEVIDTAYLDSLTQAKLPSATKDTYTFKGWYTDAEFTNAFVVDGFVATSKTVNVYAKFEKITTITFKNGEDVVAKVLLSSLKDGTASIPVTSKVGYTFNKWATDEAGENAFVYASYATDNAEVIAYAIFDAKPKVNYYDDSTLYDSKYLDEITNAYVPTNPTKEGYDFVGWYDDEDVLFVIDVESETTINAYAKWDLKQKVEFYNGDVVAYTRYAVDLTNDSLPVITKATYTFDGWFFDDSFTNTFDVDSLPSDKVVKAYAKFTKITTIIFKYGEVEASRSLLSSLKDGTATAPSVTKYGYTFINWTTDLEGTHEFAYANYVTDEATVTVYANFKENAKVIYMVDGNQYDVKYFVDDSIDNSYAPVNPTKDGYFFNCWEDANGDEFVLDVTSKTNLTAIATWYANPVVNNLTYVDDNPAVIISWTKANENTYKYSIDGAAYVNVNDADSVRLTSLTVGEHQVSVIATFKGHDSVESTITVIQKINFALTEVAFNKDSRTITWKAYTNGDNEVYYKVKFDDDTEWSDKLTTNSYTVANEVTYGTYNITVMAFSKVNDVEIGSFEARSAEVEVLSVERYDDASGLFVNEYGQYVLLTGVGYTFTGKTFTAGEYYSVTGGDTVTVSSNTPVGTVFELAATDGTKINVCVQYYTSVMSYGNNWAYYVSKKNEEANDSDHRSSFVNQTNLYEIGTGDDDYILDLNLSGTGIKITDYKLDLSGSIGGDNDVSKYLSLVKVNGKYHIQWTALAKELDNGTIAELTVSAHYYSATQKSTNTIPHITYNFKINSGANAYDLNDLQAKYGDLNNEYINMHQNITITNSDVPTEFGTSEAYNNANYSIIQRNSTDADTFILNGNYFKIDSSAVRTGENYEAHTQVGGSTYYPFVGTILARNYISSYDVVTDADGNKYYVTKRASATFKNLEIKSNGVVTSNDAASILTDSGAMDGFMITRYTTHIDNCVVHNTNEVMKLDITNASIYDYQNIDNDDSTTSQRWYVVDNNHTISESAFYDNWASSSYLWTDGRVVYRDNKVYNSLGTSIVLGNCGSGTLGSASRIAYANEELGYYLSNFPEVVFDGTDFNNWVYGDEAYYQVYGVASAIAGYKTTMGGVVTAATNNTYTLLKEGSEAGTTMINMAFQVNSGTELQSYDIGYVDATGKEIISEVRTNRVGSTDIPAHQMAIDNMSGSMGTPVVLFPVTDYSTSANYVEYKAAVTQEVTYYTGYYTGQATWDQISAVIPKLRATYGDAALQGKYVLSGTTQEEITASAGNLGQALVFTYAFNEIYANRNGDFLVQASLPNFDNSGNGVSTILIGGIKNS